MLIGGLSPFSGHKLPRDVAKAKPTRRAFRNDECLALVAKVPSGNDTALADLITLGARVERAVSVKGR